MMLLELNLNPDRRQLRNFGLGGFVAFGLYHLIGLVTNLLFYHRWSWEFVDPRFHHLGAWVILLPAAGGLVNRRPRVYP